MIITDLGKKPIKYQNDYLEDDFDMNLCDIDDKEKKIHQHKFCLEDKYLYYLIIEIKQIFKYY